MPSGFPVLSEDSACKLESSALGLIDANGFAVPFIIRGTFAGGGAVDVTIIASLPFKIRILAVFWTVTTVSATNTVSLRDATGGGGAAVTDTQSTTTAGEFVQAAVGNASRVCEAATGLYLRKSATAPGGEVAVLAVRVA